MNKFYKREALGYMICRFEGVLIIYFLLCYLIGSNKLQIRNQLCESVKQTDVGAILLTVEENYTEEFYAKYLHDFVQIVSVASQTNNDLKRRQYEVSSNM